MSNPIAIETSFTEGLLKDVKKVLEDSPVFYKVEDFIELAIEEFIDDLIYGDLNLKDQEINQFLKEYIDEKKVMVILNIPQRSNDLILRVIEKFVWLKNRNRFIAFAVAQKLHRYHHPDDLTPYA